MLATPQVTNKPYRFSVPRDVQVDYQQLLGEEKALLVDAATQLDSISLAMVESASTLQEVQTLMKRELFAFASLVPWAISLHGLRLCLSGQPKTENKA